MISIYKYPISLEEIASGTGDNILIKMPSDSEVLHVGSQAGMICLWVKVNTEKPEKARRFCIRGTGHPIEKHIRYLGTAHVPPFVWHVFE